MGNWVICAASELRNVVCSAIPTFAKWVDSLGGRMGAAGAGRPQDVPERNV